MNAVARLGEMMLQDYRPQCKYNKCKGQKILDFNCVHTIYSVTNSFNGCLAWALNTSPQGQLQKVQGRDLVKINIKQILG